jgi:hypothetical protein
MRSKGSGTNLRIWCHSIPRLQRASINYAELLAPIGFSEDEVMACVSDQSKSEQKTDRVRKRSAH